MLLFRRLIKQLVLTTLIGLVVRKAMRSDTPRVKTAGLQANRLLGGVFGGDEGHHGPSRKRRAAKSAGTALVGGAMSYFFDPAQGHERRTRAKEFAVTRLHRNGSTPKELPAARFDATPMPQTAAGTV